MLQRWQQVVLDPNVDVWMIAGAGVDTHPSELKLAVCRVVEKFGRFVEDRLPCVGINLSVEKENAQVEPSVANLSSPTVGCEGEEHKEARQEYDRCSKSVEVLHEWPRFMFGADRTT